jgi:hypothetical protein
MSDPELSLQGQCKQHLPAAKKRGDDERKGSEQELMQRIEKVEGETRKVSMGAGRNYIIGKVANRQFTKTGITVAFRRSGATALLMSAETNKWPGASEPGTWSPFHSSRGVMTSFSELSLLMAHVPTRTTLPVRVHLAVPGEG